MHDILGALAGLFGVLVHMGGCMHTSHDSGTQKLQANVATVFSQGPDLLQVWKAHYVESALV